MVAPMDAELPGRIRIGPLFDVLDMGPIYSYGDVMLGLACHRTGVATNAGSIIDYKTIVDHRITSHLQGRIAPCGQHV